MKEQHLVLDRHRSQLEVGKAGIEHAINEIRRRFDLLDEVESWDLLKRGVLSEAELTKANEVARSQSAALEIRREELAQWLEEQRSRCGAISRSHSVLPDGF